MKITPLEIRQKTFEKAFRGVDKDEVQAFLMSLSQEWERVLTEQRELKMQLEIATRDVQKMREVESSLYKTLKTAEDTSTNIIEQANKQAELQLRESRFNCDQMLSKARDQARTVIEEAYRQAEKAIADMQTEVRALEQDYQTMERYLDTMVRDLSNMANDALEKVEKSRAKPKASTSAIMNRAANVKLPRLKLDELLMDEGKMPLSNPTPAGAAPAAEATPAAVPVEAPAAAAVSSAPEPAAPVAQPAAAAAEKETPAPRPAFEPRRVSQPMRSQAAPGATRTVSPPTTPIGLPKSSDRPWPNPGPQTDPAPDHNTKEEEKTDPAPDVNAPKPEIDQPTTPVTPTKAPEVEQPEPEVPAKDKPKGPEIEQPARDFPKMPGKPEVQPPLTESARKPEPALAGSKSFFDMFG